MFVRKTAVQLIAAALVWCASDTFTAAEEPDGYVVRFYDVAALTVPHSGFPFTGALPGSSANNSDANGSFPIAAGGTVGVQSGGFGGGGGGGFGGGYFSLPPLAVQLGGENVDTVVANNTIRRDSHAESLMVLLTTMVEPTAWAEFGTTQGKGQCEVVGTSLVVRQTAAIQKEIREFLDKLTASVADGDSSLLLKSWWFPVAADRRQQLDALLAAKETTSGDRRVKRTHFGAENGPTW